MALDQPTPVSEKIGQEVRMSFGEHIEDLRSRLIKAIVGIVVASVITFWFGMDIIAWLATPFIQVLHAGGFPAHTYVRDPMLGFGVYMKVSLTAAVILASPWVVWQIWSFVVEGLYEYERRTIHILAPFSTVMTVLAILFTRYILLPVSLLFFVNFATLYPRVEPGEPEWMLRMLVSDAGPAADSPVLTPDADADGDADADADGDGATGARRATAAAQRPAPLRLPVIDRDPVAPSEGDVWINRVDGRLKAFYNGATHVMTVSSTRLMAPLPELRDYIAFATLMGLGNVAAFQLPVVMLVLGWTGVVDPAQIARLRKYAFFICAALAAVLTPADVVSMLVLLIPLYGLFELGLFLMRLSHRRYPTESE